MVLEAEQKKSKFFGHNIIYYVSQLIIAVALFAACCRLFYRQAVGYPGPWGNYISDLQVHIGFGLDGTGYSALYKVIGIFARHFGNEGVAAFESAMVVLTWYFAGKLIEKISGFRSIISLYASLGTIFLANIHLTNIFNFYYVERFVSQPWHNITYIGMRLFAVLTIYYFIDFYRNYLNRISWKSYILVTLFLFISASIKANFFVSLSASLLVALIIDFAGDRARIENLKKYFIAGSMVFPSCAVLYLQARILYPSGIASGDASAAGITLVWFADFFHFGAWNGILKIFLGISFPIIVFIMNKGGSRNFRFIGLFFLVSFFIAYVFKETGERAEHGNFYWGIMCASYILFLYSFSWFMKNWQEKFPKNKIASFVYKVVCIIIFSANVCSGFLYFNIILLTGCNYLI